MRSGARRNSPTWLILAIVLGLGFAAHARSLQIGFMADDFDLIYALDRPQFSIMDRYPAGRGTYYRPAVMASLWIERSLSRKPLIHHVVNLWLHLANGALLFGICLLAAGSRRLSAVLALLFLVHRTSAANVYWISARAETLATFGSLVTILAVLLPKEYRARVPLVLAGTTLALLSKESAVALPLVLLLLTVARHSRSLKNVSGSHARCGGIAIWGPAAISGILGAAFALYLGLRFYSEARTGLASSGAILSGLVKGFLLVVFPFSEWDLHRANPGLAIISALAIPLSLIAAWVAIRSTGTRRLALWVMLPLAAYAPVLALQGGGSARLLYLPVALACLALAAAGYSKVRGLALIVLTASMGMGTWSAGSDWIANWRLAEKCCRDFKTLTNGEAVDLFVVPRQVGEAPVFSNDARGALFYCLYGRPGYLATPPPVAEAVFIDQSSLGGLARQETSSGSLLRSLNPDRGWFVLPYWADRSLPQSAANQIPQGTILAIVPSAASGTVAEFSFRLRRLPETGPRPLLDFSGSGMEVVPRASARVP